MLRRLLALVAFPLLLAAVLLALVQAYPAPLAMFATPTAQNAEPIQLNFYDMAGIAGAADLSSEEPEPLQASAPATRTSAERSQWLTAAHTGWPLRAPDEPLRPPMALPLI